MRCRSCRVGNECNRTISATVSVSNTVGVFRKVIFEAVHFLIESRSKSLDVRISKLHCLTRKTNAAVSILQANLNSRIRLVSRRSDLSFLSPIRNTSVSLDTNWESDMLTTNRIRNSIRGLFQTLQSVVFLVQLILNSTFVNLFQDGIHSCESCTHLLSLLVGELEHFSDDISYILSRCFSRIESSLLPNRATT